MSFRSVVNWLRARLRPAPPVSLLHAQPESVEHEAERKGISIHQTLLARIGERLIVARRVQAPRLPPGVIPSTLPTDDPGHLGAYMAADSAQMSGIFEFANQAFCGLGFPGYPYLAELAQRTEYRSPTEMLAEEMTREFIELTVHGKPRKKKPKKDGDVEADEVVEDAAPVPVPRPGELNAPDEEDDDDAEENPGDPISDELQDKLEQLEEALLTFQVTDNFRKLAELDGQFGRAQLFLDIKREGAQPDELLQLPLVIDAATIPKGSLQRLKVVEPMWTSPYSYSASDPLAEDFYKPRAWFVMGKRIHATRLLTFVSREVPDMLKPAYNFGGLSLTQLMEPYVFQFLRTRNSVSDLVHSFSVMVLKTNMQNILKGEPDLPGGLLDRIRMFVDFRDNKGLMAIDKDSEDFGNVATPLGGLDKLQAQAQEHMAGPARAPLVKLFGITPAGLNADSEGEIQVFYDTIRAAQMKFYGPHLHTLLEILQLHLFGSIDKAIGFMFKPLTAPTVKERAEIRKADAETAATYIDKGVVSADEVRIRLAGDPDSGYDNLSGDAPPPPQMLDTEYGAQVAETGAQNTHARSEEAAGEQHKRDMQTAQASKPARDSWNEGAHKRDGEGKFTGADVFSETLSNALDQGVDGVISKNGGYPQDGTDHPNDPRRMNVSEMHAGQKDFLVQAMQEVAKYPKIYGSKASSEASRHLRQKRFS